MMFFVSSCRSFERELICKEVAKYQVNENEVCVVSIKFNACLCADKFDINSWSQITDFRQEPLEYCDGIMGVQKEFALKEIQPKFKALQRLRESSCQPRSKSPVSKNSNKNTSTPNPIVEEKFYSLSLEEVIQNSRGEI
jgi:hypothetical protein